jgi:hypothetical protein
MKDDSESERETAEIQKAEVYQRQKHAQIHTSKENKKHNKT